MLHRAGGPLSARALLLAAALLLAPAAAAAQNVVQLFGPATAGNTAVSAALTSVRGAVRQRVLAVSPTALEQAIAPRGIDNAENRLSRAADRNARIALALFPDAAATFRKRALEKAYGGGYVWIGSEQGGGTATLVVDGNQVTAQVEIAGRIFRIEPVSGTLHRVIEINPASLPPDAPHVRPQGVQGTNSASSAPPVASGPTPNTIVDLLVAYTTRANNAPSNIGSDINLAVSLANQAYANSGIFIRLNLRATLPVMGYDETRFDYTATLYNLTNQAGGGSTTAGRTAFAPTRARRDQVGADLVSLIREGGSFCGQAWVIAAPSAATSAYGYSQVSRGCIPGFTLAHELGHNMGLNHDRYVEPAAPASKYNFGYVQVAQRIRDIMSYPNRCTAARVVCVLKNLFSNPRKIVSGVPFGIVAGKPGAADASRRLNETRTAIASYRRTVLPVAAAASVAGAEPASVEFAAAGAN
jgi:hypothetical protein